MKTITFTLAILLTGCGTSYVASTECLDNKVQVTVYKMEYILKPTDVTKLTRVPSNIIMQGFTDIKCTKDK